MSVFYRDEKQVKNFISLAGPHAGEASVPYCWVHIEAPFVHSLLSFSLSSYTSN